MKKTEWSYLKYIIYLVNVALVMTALGILLGLSYNILVMTGGLDRLMEVANGSNPGGSVSLAVNEMTALGLIFFFARNMVTFGLLYCVRLFLKNIMAEAIFIPQNVRLTKIASILLFIGSFVTSGVFHIEDNSLDIDFFNLNYLLSAVLVWTISKVLEKANEIADENEFTI